MRVNRSLFHVRATTVVVCLLATLTVALSAQRDASKIRIKNFGCINENFYRGAQPREKDYADLAAAGVKTVVDLQQDGEAREQELVEAAGMAIYRMTHDGWTADRAYAEMKHYDFESGLGHGALKAYVYDYYSHNNQKGIAVTTDK